MTHKYQSDEMNVRGMQPYSSMMGVAATARRVDALFKAMSADYLLREQFVTDPSQVLSEYVHGARLSAEAASIRNQLLYAAMSNHRLLAWLHGYATRHGGRMPSPDKFIRDFSRAVVENEGLHIVLALIRASAGGVEVLNVEEALLPAMFAFFRPGGVLASGTEMSTGTDFGTQRSGTERSGGVFAAGTEMSTGTDFGTQRSGTERSGIFVAPSYVLVSLEALAQYAAQLRDAGALDAFRNE